MGTCRIKKLAFEFFYVLLSDSALLATFDVFFKKLAKVSEKSTT